MTKKDFQIDPVTKIDIEMERLIRKLIRLNFGNHNIIGEELEDEIKSSDYTWVIDPIDGTKNLILNLPMWSNLIGLYYKKKCIFSFANFPVLKKTNKYYNQIKKLNTKMLYSIYSSNISEIGDLFDYHWKLKRDLTKEISNNSLNDIYFKIRSIKGFLGGKLIGAGGGGFFLIIVENKKKSMDSMTKKKLNFVNLNFENNGSKILKN